MESLELGWFNLEKRLRGVLIGEGVDDVFSQVTAIGREVTASSCTEEVLAGYQESFLLRMMRYWHKLPRRWWNRRPWWCSTTMEMWYCRTCLVGTERMGQQLDLMFCGLFQPKWSIFLHWKACPKSPSGNTAPGQGCQGAVREPGLTLPYIAPCVLLSRCSSFWSWHLVLSKHITGADVQCKLNTLTFLVHSFEMIVCAL